MPSSERATMPGPSVLVFLHSFDPGGVERIALRLVDHWRGMGAPVSLFMGRTGGAMKPQFADKINFARAPKTLLPVRHFETLWMIFWLVLHVRKTRPDMLFAAGNSYAVVAVALKWLLGRRCPPVVIKISNDLVRPDMARPYRWLYRLWLRVQGRWIDRFVAMSGALAHQIVIEMQVAPGRVATIANPSLDMPRPESDAPTPEQGAGRSFCAVGRLIRQKNLGAMLRAFAVGAHPDDRLTLYGEGPERSRLERLVSRLGLPDRVHFAGFVADPVQMLPQHHVLLLSSRFEGMPSVVLEAMDAGLHVIATDCCCSMKWLLGDGRLGDLVPTGNEQAFARAIAGAPCGQRDPQSAVEKADLHRMGQVAPAYLELFRSDGLRPVAQPLHSSANQTFETGFVQ